MTNTVGTDPPENFTATLLSPSTVKFLWDAPEGSEDESYIVTCDPQPYQFPQSTSETMLKARHFTADTNYTCTVFMAHAANAKNSTSIQFKTRK